MGALGALSDVLVHHLNRGEKQRSPAKMARGHHNETTCCSASRVRWLRMAQTHRCSRTPQVRDQSPRCDGHAQSSRPFDAVAPALSSRLLCCRRRIRTVIRLLRTNSQPRHTQETYHGPDKVILLLHITNAAARARSSLDWRRSPPRCLASRTDAPPLRWPRHWLTASRQALLLSRRSFETAPPNKRVLVYQGPPTVDAVLEWAKGGREMGRQRHSARWVVCEQRGLPEACQWCKGRGVGF